MDLKEKEVVNVVDGKKLGRIVDILFDSSSGQVKGVVVPGERKLFRRNDGIYLSLEKLKRIGDDVILISLKNERTYFDDASLKNKNSGFGVENKIVKQNQNGNKMTSFVRYKPLLKKTCK